MKLAALFITVSFINSLALAEEAFVTSNQLPSYKPSAIEEAKLNSIGSDSMESLMSLWRGRYITLQPKADIRAFSQGSAAAPAALIDGSADLGPMARPMKTLEQSAFLKQFGFEPTNVVTSFAAVAVYVSKDNPLSSITLSELDAIFSKSATRSRSKFETWSELTKSNDLVGEKITTVGHTAHQPLTLYFRQRTLLQGDFSEKLIKVESEASFFQQIASNKAAIGFARAVKDSNKVKMLAIQEAVDSPAVLPTYETITNGTYPLARELSVSIVRSPGEPIDAALADFFQFVFSSQGQEVVESEGFIPLSPELRLRELAKLQ